jgi:hypothetical protein
MLACINLGSVSQTANDRLTGRFRPIAKSTPAERSVSLHQMEFLDNFIPGMMSYEENF